MSIHNCAWQTRIEYQSLPDRRQIFSRSWKRNRHYCLKPNANHNTTTLNDTFWSDVSSDGGRIIHQMVSLPCMRMVSIGFQQLLFIDIHITTWEAKTCYCILLEYCWAVIMLSSWEHADTYCKSKITKLCKPKLSAWTATPPKAKAWTRIKVEQSAPAMRSAGALEVWMTKLLLDHVSRMYEAYILVVNSDHPCCWTANRACFYNYIVRSMHTTGPCTIARAHLHDHKVRSLHGYACLHFDALGSSACVRFLLRHSGPIICARFIKWQHVHRRHINCILAHLKQFSSNRRSFISVSIVEIVVTPQTVNGTTICCLGFTCMAAREWVGFSPGRS